jgi:hypothetical protein
MAVPDPRMKLTLMWLAAAVTGLAIGTISFFHDDPNSRLLAVLLVLGALPFGLARPNIPVIWALVIGWPTAVMRTADIGGVSILMLVYCIVGVYFGDWCATWYAEAHPQLPANRLKPDGTVSTAAGDEIAADGTAMADDGLPPTIPQRWTNNLR